MNLRLIFGPLISVFVKQRGAYNSAKIRLTDGLRDFRVQGRVSKEVTFGRGDLGGCPPRRLDRGPGE